MIIIDSREPSSVAVAIGEAAISKNKHYLPADEIILKKELYAGDFLVTTINRPLPENLAQYMEWVADNQLESPPLDEVLADLPKAVFATLARKSILIERKTPQDFLASIVDGRLFSQTLHLVESSLFSIIVITGEFEYRGDFVYVDGRRTEWNYLAIVSAQLRVQQAGCAVVHVHQDALASFVCNAWKWLLEGTKLVRKPKPLQLIPLSNEAEFLCGLPGIGPEKANEVLGYAGSLTSALHFLTDTKSANLSNRPSGIGKQTIENIRSFFDLEDNEVILRIPE